MTDTRYCECDEHGPQRHAYIVCVHLIDGRDRKRVAHVRPWKNAATDGAGELCCDKSPLEHSVDELRLMCEDHLLEMGLLLPGEARLQ